MRHTFAFGVLSTLVSVANSAAADKSSFSLDSDDDIKKSAGILAGDLVRYYHGNETGEIPGLLPDDGQTDSPNHFWWYESAFLWQTLIDYWHYTGDGAYNSLIIQGLLFQTGDGNDFTPVNQTATMGNDDQGLWGIAAMLAAERNFANPPSDKPQWLDLAQAVFDDLAARWDAKSCGGGLRWQIASFNQGYNYKNSISNGCLFNLGARLARFTGNQTYADWADKTWDWVEKAGYITSDFAVYDGATVQNDCKDTVKQQWTYTNAIFLEGASFMYNYTNGDSKWRARAEGLSKSGIKTFFPDKVAVEVACEKNNKCDPEMKSFKGLLHRWYASATQVAPFLSDGILPTLKTSAEAAVSQCTGGNDSRQCGSHWASGKYDGTTGAQQEMSVLSAVSSLLVSSAASPRTEKTQSQGNDTKSGGDAASDGSASNNTKGGSGDDKSAAGKHGAYMLTTVLASSALVLAAGICL